MITRQFTGLRALARLPAARLSARSALHRSIGSRFSGFRLSSSATKQDAQNAAEGPRESATKSKKPLYPERLLIYNAGTGKTTYIAFTKLGTVIFFAFGCLVIAPGLHANPDSPWWAAPAAIFFTSLPLLITATATSPFVNSIYLHLPPYARSSRPLLRRFAAAPPPSTRLDIRTIRLNGFWKTTGTTIAELRKIPQPPRFGFRGLANLERVPAAAEARSGAKKGAKRKRSVLQAITSVLVDPRRRFYVNPAEGARRSAEPGVVEMVMRAVAGNSAREQQQQQRK